MIAPGSDWLFLELDNGERVPCSADMVDMELACSADGLFDAEFIHQVTRAVFHYFKHELGRQSVAAAEFAGAMEKVLRGFTTAASAAAAPVAAAQEVGADLCRLARESGPGRELIFFPRLRAELRRCLGAGPRWLRFSGLRACVKHLAGARRWSRRCQALEGEIVAYLRECLRAEPEPMELVLRVE